MRSSTGMPSSSLASWISVRRVMPSSTLLVMGEVTSDAVAHHEEVGGAALGDVAVLVEYDGVVVAVQMGFALDEGAVDVAADELAAGGDSRVVDATPTACAHAHAVCCSPGIRQQGC